MNERMRILKLLEQGKINAEEAERLLEAVSESSSGRRRGFFGQGFEFISEVIPGLFETSFRNYGTPEKSEFAGKNKIELKGISGNITLTGTENSKIVLEKDGFAKTYDEGDMLGIKLLSGDIKINCPKNILINIRAISADLFLDNFSGNIEIHSVSGDVAGTKMRGSFNGEFISGNVNLEYEDVQNILIKSRSGDITLKIDENIESEIEVSNVHGDIQCTLPLKDVTKRHNYLKGILNNPKARIEIMNNHGDVILEKRFKK